MKNPKILTPLPGPKAKKLIEIDEECLSPSLTRTAPLVGVKTNGVWVEDIDGNTFLDFGSGIAVANVGHRHPEVVKAVKEQIDKCDHVNSCDYYTVPQVEYALDLFKMTPGNFKKRVFFANSGTEAVECGIKVAKWHTKRYYFISFIGGFHGRTMGALSLTTTGLSVRRNYAPLMSGVYFVPYAYCYRCVFKQTYPECNLYCLDYLEDVVFKKIVVPEETAGIIVEPIQGAGGYIVPPNEFLPRLVEICRKNGILLVDDEVQTGFARTGKMWACEHWGVEPDILCMSKAMAGGLPCGACVTRKEVMNWTPSSHENTLGGNPIVISAAQAILRIIKDEGLVEKAAKQGKYLFNRFEELKETHEIIGDVRGKGLMIGIEFVKNRRDKTPAVDQRDKMILEAFKRGLLLLGAGQSSLRLAPPLIINREDLDLGVDLFEQTLKFVESS
jgi:4-aminobutyrate aminotransferase